MWVPILALTSLLLLTLACSGDEGDGAPSPTLFPPLEDTPGATAIPPPVPTLGPAVTEVRNTLWLIDAQAGAVVTLYEDAERSAFALFDDSTASVLYQAAQGTVRTGLDGKQIDFYAGRGPQDVLAGPSPWESTEQGCRFEDRLYAGIPCGAVSPNGRWMTYVRNAQDAQPTGRTYDLWVVDLEMEETWQLVGGLFSCTQCDSGPPFQWSSSGDYLITGDSGNQNRIFLIDVRAATARDINPSEFITDLPQWSPAGELIARPGEDGLTILEDLAAGTSVSLANLPWPARFDPSGTYLYSLASNEGRPPHPPLETQVVRVEDGATSATLPGGVGYDPAQRGQARLPLPGDALVRSGDSFVAALATPPGCDGTGIYAGLQLVTCVQHAGGAAVSPDATMVALIRKTGVTGPVNTPGLQSLGLDIYEIAVVDVATGHERVMAQGALGLVPPHVTWNAASTHLLVRWPNHFGP